MLHFSCAGLLSVAASLFVLSHQCGAFHILRTEREASDETSRCLRPSSKDCSWYTKCLGARISCDGASDSYTPARAERLCNSSIQNYPRLSSRGKEWADAAMTCSQDKLLPMFRQAPSCRVFTTKGAAAQAQCTLNPKARVPGLCDLPIEDLRVIKDVLLNSLDLGVLVSLAGQIRVPISSECTTRLLQLMLFETNNLWKQQA